MGLQFKPTQSENISTEVAETEKNFDIVKQREQFRSQLANSKEIDDITSTIDVSDAQTIVNFGSNVAEEISKCSDNILNSIDMSQINNSGELLNTLGKIMDQFDIQEISAEEKKGLLGKIFGGVEKQIDKILAKYHSMGDEVDKIYVKLKEYEAEIKGSNQKLNSIFESNLNYYQELVKYIFAGEQGISEIDQYLEQLKKDYEENPDNMLQLDISNLEQAKSMLEQRVQDLRIAENVAMQSIPMIKSMEYGNINLIRKINSAFIITLPVFKQALTQAVLLKRQKIQAKAMQALDEKTNEMLIKNAKNTVEQSKLTAALVSGSSVKVETLEKTWSIIVNGIEETRKIQEDARKKREEDTIKLNTLKEDFKNKMSSEKLM